MVILFCFIYIYKINIYYSYIKIYETKCPINKFGEFWRGSQRVSTIRWIIICLEILLPTMVDLLYRKSKNANRITLHSLFLKILLTAKKHNATLPMPVVNFLSINPHLTMFLFFFTVSTTLGFLIIYRI